MAQAGCMHLISVHTCKSIYHADLLLDYCCLLLYHCGQMAFREKQLSSLWQHFDLWATVCVCISVMGRPSMLVPTWVLCYMSCRSAKLCLCSNSGEEKISLPWFQVVSCYCMEVEWRRYRETETREWRAATEFKAIFERILKYRFILFLMLVFWKTWKMKKSWVLWLTKKCTDYQRNQINKTLTGETKVQLNTWPFGYD